MTSKKLINIYRKAPARQIFYNYFLTLVISILIVLTFISCVVPENEKGTLDPEDKGSDKSKIKLFIYGDSSVEVDGNTVEKIKLDISKIDIVDYYKENQPEGTFILKDDPQVIDILKYTENNPLKIVNKKIKPSKYIEIRFYLGDNNHIVIDKHSHPLNIPDEILQSGFVLVGPFFVEEKKNTEVLINFKADEYNLYYENDCYNYRPRVELNTLDGKRSGTKTYSNIYKGDTTAARSSEAQIETTLRLARDNTFDLKDSQYPSYTITGNYSIVNDIIRFEDVGIKGLRYEDGDCSIFQEGHNVLLSDLISNVPQRIGLPSRFEMTRAGEKLTLTVPTINPPSNPSFPPGFELIDFHQVEIFTITKRYTDVSVTVKGIPQNTDDRYVVLTAIPVDDYGMIENNKEPIQAIKQYNCGKAITINFKVDNDYFVGDYRNFKVMAYTYKNDSIDKGTSSDVNLYADVNAGIMMTGSRLNSSTNNPWSPETNIITVVKDQTQTHTINFRTFNITLDHKNFTEPAPILRWEDDFTNATKYLVMVMVSVDASTNKNLYDSNDFWDLIYYDTTAKKELELGMGLFYDYEDEDLIKEYNIPEIKIFRPGEILRIEVYALNNNNRSTSDIDFSKYKGAYFMDSINIVRN